MVREVKEGLGLGSLEEVWLVVVMVGMGVWVLDGMIKGEYMRGDFGVGERVREWRGEREENERKWERWVGEVRGLVGG